MKIIFYTFITFMFLVSCGKQSLREFKKDTIEGENILSPVAKLIKVPKPIKVTTCVNSFQELIDILGASEIYATAVVLENGEMIGLGNGIASITYRAVEQKEDYSLFRSQLQLDFNIYGYNQTHFTDTWTLGCKFFEAAIPPFTNILKGNQLILINTCFIWGIPPFGANGFRVLYIIVT